MDVDGGRWAVRILYESGELAVFQCDRFRMGLQLQDCTMDDAKSHRLALRVVAVRLLSRQYDLVLFLSTSGRAVGVFLCHRPVVGVAKSAIAADRSRRVVVPEGLRIPALVL